MTILTPSDISAVDRLMGGSARATVRAIAAEVSEITGVPVDTIMGRKRTALVSGARAIVAHRAHEIGITGPQLARVFGRNVSTVKHILALEEQRRACISDGTVPK